MMVFFVIFITSFVRANSFLAVKPSNFVRPSRHCSIQSFGLFTLPESNENEESTRTSTREVCAAIQKAGRAGAWAVALAEHRRYISERSDRSISRSDSEPEFVLLRSARATKKCSTVFSATMGALATCGRPVEAATLWDEFRDTKLGPMPAFFGNELLRALGTKKSKGGPGNIDQRRESDMNLDSRADLALTVLASMQRGCNSIKNKADTSTKTTIPSNSTFNTACGVNSSPSVAKVSPFCPDAFTFANTLMVLAEAGRWQQALVVFQAVPNSILRSSAAKSSQEQVLLSACITASANAKPPRPDIALALLASGSPDVVAYSAALTCLERAGDWTGALKLLKEMMERGVKPNAYTYAAAIGACATGGQWSEALSLLRDAERCDDEAVSSTKEPSPRRSTRPHSATKERVATAPVYAAAVRALARAPAAERDSRKALALLQRMVTRGVAPTTRTANAYLDVLARSGDSQAAMALLQCMSTRNSGKSRSSRATFGKEDRSEIGQFRDPRHLPQDDDFEFLGIAKADLVTYNTALAACSRAAATEAAASGTIATSKSTSEANSALTVIWARAMELARSLRRDDFQPDETTAGTLLLCAAHVAGDGRPDIQSVSNSNEHNELNSQSASDIPIASQRAARGAAVVLRVLDKLLHSGIGVSHNDEVNNPLIDLASPSLEAAADELDKQGGWITSQSVAADILAVLSTASDSSAPLSEETYPAADEGVLAAAFVATEQAGSPRAALAVLREASRKYSTESTKQQQQRSLPVSHACAVLGAIARSPTPKQWASYLVLALLAAASTHDSTGAVAADSFKRESTLKSKDHANDVNAKQGDVALRVAAALAWLAAGDGNTAATVLAMEVPVNGNKLEQEAGGGADCAASTSTSSAFDAKASTMAVTEVFRVLGDTERWPSALSLFGALLDQGGLQHARSRAATLLLLRRLLRAPSLSSTTHAAEGSLTGPSAGGRLPFRVSAFLRHAFVAPHSSSNSALSGIVYETDADATTAASAFSFSSSSASSIHAWREAGGAQACLREACLAYNEVGEFERADEAYAMAMATGIATHWVLDASPTATRTARDLTSASGIAAAAPGKVSQSQWAVDLHGCSMPVAEAAIRAALREHHARFPPPPSALNVAQALQSDQRSNNVAVGGSPVATSVTSLSNGDGSSVNSSVSEGDARGFVDLVVITGRGLHSSEWMRPVLRPDVQTLLVERFHPPISSWTVPGNTGRLVVDAVGIAAWAEQSKQTKAALMRRLSGALFTNRIAARQDKAQ